MEKPPNPNRKTVRYFLLASLGLHALVLLFPLPPSPPLEKEIPLQIVRLRKQALPQPKLVAKQKLRLKKQPAVKSSPKVTRPKPPALTVSPTPSPTPSPSPSPLAKPTPSPTPSPTPEPGEVLAVFSKVEGAVAGCQNSTNGQTAKNECWQVNETQWRSLASNLEKEFERKGYNVDKLEDRDDEEGMGVYKVSKAGKPEFYLHFLQTPNSGTVYFLDDKPLNRTDLEQAIGV